MENIWNVSVAPRELVKVHLWLLRLNWLFRRQACLSFCLSVCLSVVFLFVDSRQTLLTCWRQKEIKLNKCSKSILLNYVERNSQKLFVMHGNYWQNHRGCTVMDRNSEWELIFYSKDTFVARWLNWIGARLKSCRLQVTALTIVSCPERTRLWTLMSQWSWPWHSYSLPVTLTLITFCFVVALTLEVGAYTDREVWRKFYSFYFRAAFKALLGPRQLSISWL